MQLTPKEYVAVFISRQIKNGEYVSLGTNLPVPSAGVLLAHLTHAPDLSLSILSYFANLSSIDYFEDLTQIANPSVAKWADSVMSIETLSNGIRQMDLCFVGGVQIDKYGNCNLIGVGPGPGQFKFRGPGPVGTPTIMSTVKKFFIFTNALTPKVFVEKCDFVSAVGWGNGGDDARLKLGLPGGGPQYVITPQAILDFEEGTKRMRLKHVIPPATIEEVKGSVGFELVIPDSLEPLPEPTAEEIEVLRNRVDRKGLLREGL